jgi:hypothetical protein
MRRLVGRRYSAKAASHDRAGVGIGEGFGVLMTALSASEKLTTLQLLFAHHVLAL